MKKHDNLIDIDRLKDAISIPNIKSTSNFWMMRTKNGAFYREFVNDGFIAIGWNIIKKADLKMATAKSKNERLRLLIEENYPKEAQPGSPVNKCIRFVKEIQPDDIVMIVGDNEVTFAIIGEYYEAKDVAATPEREKEINQLIDDGAHKSQRIKCPYAKRHQIHVVNSVSKEKLNPMLFKALILNRHSISNLNDYAEYVLSACYDAYNYHNKLSLTLHVSSEKELGSLDISRFVYYSTQLLCYEQDRFISTKINLNSPGDIILTLENGLSYIEQHWHSIVLLCVLLFGEDIQTPYGTIPIPSLRKAILTWKQKDRKNELDKLELDERKEIVRGLKLDNDLKEENLNRLKKTKSAMFSTNNDDIDTIMNNISDSAKVLKIRPIGPNIIPFEKCLVHSQEDSK